MQHRIFGCQLLTNVRHPAMIDPGPNSMKHVKHGVYILHISNITYVCTPCSVCVECRPDPHVFLSASSPAAACSGRVTDLAERLRAL